MEIKLIIYAIGGILYFLYKKSQEDKKAVPKPASGNEEQPEPEPKPVRPPANNPLDEARRELKRRQEALEAQRKLSTPSQQPILSSPKANVPKDIFIHEKKKATFGEGVGDAPVYERELLESEKTVRGDIRLKNEGIYRVETMEEARALADDVGLEEYEFDAKQAFIGSVIFERKF